MLSSSAAVYVAAVIALFFKYLVATTVQARERFATRRFRYAEDAAFWRGEVGEDSERCQRAQGLLRNDGESQPFFFVLGAAYVLLGLPARWALAYFGAYVLSRFVHAYFFLRARQPHRNRAFSFGLLALLALAVHVALAV